MKCLWNPEFKVDAAIDEYCRRMYGPAADEMRQLVKLQTEGWENSRWPGGKISAKNVYTISFPPAMRAKMKELLETIRVKTHNDPTLAARVAYYTQPFDAFILDAGTVGDDVRSPGSGIGSEARRSRRSSAGARDMQSPKSGTAREQPCT